MKAYLIEMIIVDHQNEGPDAILRTIDCMKYYAADVISITEADIGGWSDDHLLNDPTAKIYQKREYFNE